MDFQRRQQRIGILTVILCLLVVVVWRMYSPDMKTYRMGKREAKLKQAMLAVNPPSQAKVISIQTYHLNEHLWGIGLYSYDSDFDKVQDYYVQEFGRHGFTYGGEKNRQSSSRAYQFCATEYNAILSRTNVNMYSVDWNPTPC
jgi:hypothetical protein